MNKIILILLLLSAPAWAEERHDDGGSVELSREAAENYGIRTEMFLGGPVITLPRDALVISKDECFVYEKRDGHFMEIGITPAKITGESVVFSHGGPAEFAISGAKYLRIIFLNDKNPETGHH
jgi:hypothetical protein